MTATAGFFAVWDWGTRAGIRPLLLFCGCLLLSVHFTREWLDSRR
jgi:hypothetical protein